MIEFLLTVPFVMFLAGLTVHTANGLLTKQRTILDARHQVYLARDSWSSANVDTSYDGSGSGDASRPRGTGESLDRLRSDIESDTLDQVSSASAVDFWNRVFGNLPGRQSAESTRSFETQGELYAFIPTALTSDHRCDQNEWRFSDIDVWRIARSGPLQVVFAAFLDNLQGEVAAPFEKTRTDILDRWWRGQDALEEAQQADETTADVNIIVIGSVQ